MSWNPFKWFNNRAAGMSDTAKEAAFNQNPNRVEFTTIDGGGVGPTSVYNTWNDYDAGRSSGSYSNESPSFVSQFGNFAGNVGKSFLSNYMKNRTFGGAAEEKPAFAIGGSPGGFKTSKIPGGSPDHSFYQYQFEKPTIIGGTPGTPGRPGIGEQVVSAAIPLAMNAIFACDERIKVDMAPLESSDINDDLAEIAFFVKGIRECS